MGKNHLFPRSCLMTVTLAVLIMFSLTGADPLRRSQVKTDTINTKTDKDLLRRNNMQDRMRVARNPHDIRSIMSAPSRQKPSEKMTAKGKLLAKYNDLLSMSDSADNTRSRSNGMPLEFDRRWRLLEELRASHSTNTTENKLVIPVNNESLDGNTAGDFGRTLLVASWNTSDITRYDAETGQFLGYFVQSGAGGLFNPHHMTMGADGNVYVADAGADAVMRFAGDNPDPRSDCFGLSPGDPCPGPLGAPNSAEFVPSGSGGLSSAREAVFGPDGHLYVPSLFTDQVLRYDGKTGAFIGVFVESGSGGLYWPIGMDFGPHDGHLYVASFRTSQILRYHGQTGAYIDVFASVCQGSPPDNDDCEFAQMLTHIDGNPENDIVLEYDIRCANLNPPLLPFVTRDIWYNYTAPCDGTLTVDTCEVDVSWDNLVVIYDGGEACSCPTDALDYLALADDTCGGIGVTAIVTTEVTAGNCYKIEVAGWGGSTGTGVMNVSISCEGSSGVSVAIEPTRGQTSESPNTCDTLLFDAPRALRFGPDGNLYVASQGSHSVARFDGTTGDSINNFVCPGSGGLETPKALRFGPDDNLFVTSLSPSVLRYYGPDHDQSGAFIDEFVSGATIVNPMGLLFPPVCGDANCEVGESFCNCTQDCPLPKEFDDCNFNGIPDSCEPDEDCNINTVTDICDIFAGTSEDCNENDTPDECEPDTDCNTNGIQDICDVVGDIGDCNHNDIPDDCESDCNTNGIPDDCDITGVTSSDCNRNTIPDECDITAGVSPDNDGDGVPDECESPMLFVDAAASGANTGITWLDAYVDLQDALATAAGSAGTVTEIRVAQGTYGPDRDTGDRSATFQLVSQVRLVGGYASSAADNPDERDVERFETILSGDLKGDDMIVEPEGGGTPDDQCENAGPINIGKTSFDNIGATTDGPNPVDCESGPQPLEADIWYVYTHTCDADQVEVNLCGSHFNTFIAVYDGDTCPPTTELACNDNSCGISRSQLTFSATQGRRYLLRVGGWNGDTGEGVISITCLTAMTNTENSYHVVTGTGADETAVLDGFTVMGGNADGNNRSGGGLYSESDGPTSGPTLIDCTFRRNRADDLGGGVACFGSNPTLLNCVFDRNSAGFHGGLSVWFGGHTTITNCTFTNNEAEVSAGAGACLQGSATYTNCVFRGNSAEDYGGAVGSAFDNATFSMNATFTDCLFVGNSATWGGGAVDVRGNGVVTLTNCTFSGNSAYFGGGVFMIQFFETTDPPILTINGCTFRNNSARFGGGSGNFVGVSPTINNCLFIGNRAFGAGGAIDNFQSSNPVLTNCTLIGNSANIGGGIESFFNSNPTLSNCLLWGNSDNGGVGESAQILTEFGTSTVNYCNIQGWTGELGGEENIGVNPLLTPDGHLRSGSPSINAGDPKFMIDPSYPFDIDGDLRIVDGRVDMGADEFVDLDLDRLPDWWELMYFHSQFDGVASDDSDDDGITNLDEYERYSSNPIAPPFYVSGTAGRDANDGRAITHEGQGVGPKKTIQAALDVASNGDTVLTLAQSQPYKGPGNVDLNYHKKSIVLRSLEGSNATTIDLQNFGRIINTDSILGTAATLEGFTITNGEADLGGGLQTIQTGLQIKDCILENNNASNAGGGLFAENSNPTIDDLTLTGNTAPFGDSGFISNTSVNLEGSFYLDTGVLKVQSSWFDGPGRIELASGTLMHIFGDFGSSPTVIRSDLVGTGDVLIDLGHELQVGGGATIDLSGNLSIDSCADPDVSDQWGTIFVKGELFVQDGTIQNTKVVVSLAEFVGNTDIINNDITLLNASAGFGGQFFVDGSTIIQCNTITSDGDRYLDLDPDPASDDRPTIQDNRFHVIITQGAEGEQGEILELRIQDYDCNLNGSPDCPSGALELPASQGFSDTWALESLELNPNSKVTLTNRKGMVFQDPMIPISETVYVKDLILGAESVLNVGLQRLYYQRLTDEFGNPLIRDPKDPTAPMANGSRIIDVPLIGFSLGIISMEDDTEFDVRVRTRLTQEDPNDPFALLPVGLIAREEGLISAEPDTGVMDMRTFNAKSVAAKGAFARATEDNIIVAFQYLFQENPAAELVVYLSDDPDVSKNIGNEIARIFPPAPGLAGSIGSDEFAFFYGSFPRGSFNFIRGTYVELELRNPGSRIWIDEWDPGACCADCGTFATGCDGLVGTGVDYLYLLSEYGHQVSGAGATSTLSCMDSPLSGDGYIDISDLLSWELVYSGDDLLNICSNSNPLSAIDSSSLGVTPPPNTLLVAGKQSFGQEDFLYSLDMDGKCIGDRLSPASAPSINGYRANGRLIKDVAGNLYQLHSMQGLIRLDNAEIIITPQITMLNNQNIHVGITGNIDGELIGVPITDVAFDPDDESVIYVVPVLVVPPVGMNCPEPDGKRIDPYKAVAKLRFTNDPNGFVVEQLFGSAPCPGDDCCNVRPCSNAVCNKNRLREVEIDSFGNLFVTSSQVGENNWLLIYNMDNGTEQHILLDEPISPIAMTLSSAGDALYMASSVESDGARTRSELFRFPIDSKSRIPDITNKTVIAIENMRQITALAENDGSIWVVGFMAESFGENKTFSVSDGIFTKPMLAVVPEGDTTAMADVIECHDLALPLSIVSLSSSTTCQATAVLMDQSDPPNGAIDARRPLEDDGTTPIGLSFIDVAIEGKVECVFADQFSLLKIGGDGFAPNIAKIIELDSTHIRVQLTEAMEPGTRLVLTHDPSGTSTCLGYLPGDVNGDGTASSDDILNLIEYLSNQIPPSEFLSSCDMDRSGLCTTADILTAIDLLNGAGSFDPWLGYSLDPCPQ